MELLKNNYAINEELAKRAKNSYSFTDYFANSATDSYNKRVSLFEDTVKGLIGRCGEPTPDQMDLINYYFDKFCKKLAFAINRENQITASCPSVMITGSSNFPVRKKEKQNEAQSKHWSEYGSIMAGDIKDVYYYNKIANMLTNSTIYSNDALAIEKLQNKLVDLEESQLNMKKANAHYRKQGTMKGFEDITDEAAAALDDKINKGYSWDKQPYPSYHLTNNNGSIKQVKDRIAELTALKERAAKPIENKYIHVDGLQVVENAELMRIQLLFDNKPSEEERAILKSHGFKWAPSQSAWQRQLTVNAIYATKTVLEKLKNIK